VIISILDESLFSCAEYHSEFRPLEVGRHELLSDRMEMHYFEVRKLPKDLDAENELQLMLSLFRAKTEEELKLLKELEVPVVTQAIEAYRTVTGSDEFKELERLRFLASCNEASALEYARRKEREKLRGALAKKDAALAAVIADKAAALADKDATIAAVVADKNAALADNKVALANNKAVLADKDAEIMRLRALLDNLPN
jgi:hypothetical protein